LPWLAQFQTSPCIGRVLLLERGVHRFEQQRTMTFTNGLMKPRRHYATPG
tara:strand:- start:819 stop:968 length:150 start_codon:yes stop_codon:yes gene_type:complete